MRLRSYRTRSNTQKSKKHEDDTAAETTDDDSSLFSRIVSLSVRLLRDECYDDVSENEDDKDDEEDSLHQFFLHENEKKRHRSKGKVFAYWDRYDDSGEDETLTVISLRPKRSRKTLKVFTDSAVATNDNPFGHSRDNSQGMMQRNNSSRKDHTLNEKCLFDQDSLAGEGTLDHTALTESPTLDHHGNAFSCMDFIVIPQSEKGDFLKNEDETILSTLEESNHVQQPFLALIIDKLTKGIKPNISSRKDFTLNKASVFDQDSLAREGTIDDTVLTEFPTLDDHGNVFSCVDFIILSKPEQQNVDKSQEETVLSTLEDSNHVAPPFMFFIVDKLKKGMKRNSSSNDLVLKKRSLLKKDSLAKKGTHEDTALIESPTLEDHDNTFNCADFILISKSEQPNVDQSQEAAAVAAHSVAKDSNRVAPPPVSAYRIEESRKQNSSWTSKIGQDDKVGTATAMCLQEDDVTEFLSFLSRHDSQVHGMCTNFNRADVLHDIQETMWNALRMRKSMNSDLPLQVYHEKFSPICDESEERKSLFRKLWCRPKLWLPKIQWHPNRKHCSASEPISAQSQIQPSKRKVVGRQFLIRICRCISYQKAGKKQRSESNDVDYSSRTIDDEKGRKAVVNSDQTNCNQIKEDELDQTPAQGQQRLCEFLYVIIEVDHDGSYERNIHQHTSNEMKSDPVSPLSLDDNDTVQCSVDVDVLHQSRIDSFAQKEEEEEDSPDEVEIVFSHDDNEKHGLVELFHPCFHGLCEVHHDMDSIDDDIDSSRGETLEGSIPTSTNLSMLTTPIDDLSSSLQMVIDAEEEVIEVR